MGVGVLYRIDVLPGHFKKGISSTLPIKITGVAVLCIYKTEEGYFAKGQFVIQLHLLCMPVGLSKIKKAIPKIKSLIDSRVLVIVQIEIITDNVIVGPCQI